jgi:ABC-type Na+ efflux pump permease subunit
MLLRKIWFVAAKDLLQLRHDRSAFIFMFAVPLFLMGILGSVFSGFGLSSLTVTIPVVNRDGGSGAAALLSSLRNDPSIRVKVQTDLKGTKKAVRDGTDVGVLIIPTGFTAAVNGLSHSAKLDVLHGVEQQRRRRPTGSRHCAEYRSAVRVQGNHRQCHYAGAAAFRGESEQNADCAAHG